MTLESIDKVVKGSLRKSKGLSLISRSISTRYKTCELTYNYSESITGKGLSTKNSVKIIKDLQSPTKPKLFSNSSSYHTKIINSSQEKPDNKIMSSKYIVGHDKEKKFFYIKLQDAEHQKAHLAKLEYDYVRPGVVDLWHTEVPPEFQGHGIAKHLAKAAFDHFCDNEIKTRPTCTYLQKYLKDFPVARYLDNVDKTS